MVATDRVRDLFEDARGLRLGAMEQFAQGDVRDAAEKAWCATRRATDGLILAMTGEEPSTSTQTGTQLRVLAQRHDEVKPLRNHYSVCARELHSDCFYNGQCEPVENIAERIEDTARYIEELERLSGRA